MSIGKKEIRLLIILGLIIYAFLLYKMVIVKSLPKITEVEKKITVAKAQRAKLDNDIKNIEIKKLDLNAKTVSYEKMGGYIPENAGIEDTVEYIEKLSKLVGKEFQNVSISLPTGVNSKGSSNSNEKDSGKSDEKGTNQYYVSTCSFSAYLDYNEVLDLLSFIEGSTKRVGISNFSIVPEDEIKDKKGASPAPSNAGNESQQFKTNMTIDLYSMKVDSNDFGNSRLSRYLDNGWLIKGQDNSADLGGTQITQPVGSGASKPASTNPSQASALDETDMEIIETSVMGAGNNLNIFGVEPKKDMISIKNGERTDVKFKLDGNFYTLETRDSGKTKNFRCSIANKNEITVRIKLEFPDIEENKDISLNLIVTNNTSKKINVLIEDQYGRVKIKDRSGSVVNSKSDREKLQII